MDYRCLDEGHPLAAVIEAFDGRNWESARASLHDD